jgi:glutaredoxin-dependent peroxiredoxin
MTELLHEINIRRSFRAFSDKKISEDAIKRIMTAATYAPSCFNNQSWRFLVATEDEALNKVFGALSEGNYWFKHAKAAVVVATKPALDCVLNDRREYALFDCGLAAQNLMLQAFNEGLYAHAIAGYEPLKIKEAFNIPDDYIVITLIALGYPGDDNYLNEKHKGLEHSPRDRKPETAVICYNKWSLNEQK